METNVANFFEYKKRHDLHVLYIGDCVEWQDFDGQTYQSKITKIEHKPLAGFDFTESVECLPMWEKEEYILHFESTSVLGDIILRKIVKKPGNKAHKFSQISRAQ
jgi:hypothetical protein